MTEGDLQKSLAAFANISPSFKWVDFGVEDDYRGFTGISDYIFGCNQEECFNCSEEEIMRNDYLALFPFIKKIMNKKELVEALIQLEKTGEQDDETGAIANYLLGNFFNNVSLTGYYRHILRFYLNNGANYVKFTWQNSPEVYGPDIYNGVYFKDYWENVYYGNQARIANNYLKKAYEQAGNNNLKAHIAFALSKCNRDSYLTVGEYDEEIDISEEYFAELAKYKNTEYYDEVRTYCKYFEYYLNHISE